MRPHLQEIVVDCAEPAALAEFWGDVLESRWAVRDESWAMVDAAPLLVAFQRVPEPKSSPKHPRRSRRRARTPGVGSPA
ncbi:hypothetical protein BH11ACT1_BH11ACT1_22640 [soil metagenome]